QNPQPHHSFPQNPPVNHPPHDPGPQNPPALPQPEALEPGVTHTNPEGGTFANIDYREYREDGAILIGFHVGLPKVPDTAVVTYSHPDGGIVASLDSREYGGDGAVRIGFEVGLGKVPDTAVGTYLRRIWLTAKGEQFGTAYGRTKNPISTVKARDGYAIGGVR